MSGRKHRKHHKHSEGDREFLKYVKKEAKIEDKLEKLAAKEVVKDLALAIEKKVEKKDGPLDDSDAKALAQQWQAVFKDAMVLPKVGYPSINGKGVVTITHTMGDGKLMDINGQKSNSPLANNALYSAEYVKGKYLNLYEIMIPDIPGDVNAKKRRDLMSTVQIYVKSLSELGLVPSGNHYHWNGSSMDGYPAFAIHTQSNDLTPAEFSDKMLKALMMTMAVIEQRKKARK